MPPDDLLSTLHQLKPAPTSLNRDQLLYEAGRRSVRRTVVWPLATAASLMLACGSILIHWQSVTTPQQFASATVAAPEVVATSPRREEPQDVLSPFSYLTLREVGFPKHRPVSSASSVEAKPMPILTAGSYASPDWMR